MLKPPPHYDARLVLRPEQDTEYVHFEHAAEHPFQPDALGVSRVNAWWLAEAALATYGDPAKAVPLYRAAGLEAQFVSGSGSDCYVAFNDRVAIVAFRGTEGDQWEDVLTDLHIVQVGWKHGRGHVHAGFAAAIDLVWPSLQPLIDDLATTRQIWFTGHSLGAALATLAADRYEGTRGICTFGCPRVGDQAFAMRFTTRLLGRHFRYVNNRDIVTHVPPPVLPPFLYRHVDPRRWIDAHGHVSFGAPPIPHFFTELFGSPNTLLDMIRGMQAGTFLSPPPALLDHMPKAYAIWTWNDYQRHL